MVPFFLHLYPWTLALHVVSFIAWMAGLLYLPRLYVYHSGLKPGSEASELFKVMERKLYKLIMTPAMLATFGFGIILALTPGLVDWHSLWFYVKIACVLGLASIHGAMNKWRKDFLADRNTRNHRFFRIANEIPTVLMLVAVVMVVVQPF